MILETDRTAVNIGHDDMIVAGLVTDTEVGQENTEDEIRVIHRVNVSVVDQERDMHVFVVAVRDITSETVELRHGQWHSIKNI